MCVTKSCHRLSVRNRCIVAKRCEIGPKLLLITNKKSHIAFQMTKKSSTLDDLESQYCNRNCILRSAPLLATARFSCFLNSSVKHWPIVIIFDMRHQEET